MNTEFKIKKFLKNMRLSPIKVRHQDLTRSTDDSIFKSTCPECKEPGLFVARNSTTFKLEKEDFCIFCGRRFYYTDIMSNIVLVYKDKKLDKLEDKNLFPEKLALANEKLKNIKNLPKNHGKKYSTKRKNI